MSKLNTEKSVKFYSEYSRTLGDKNKSNSPSQKQAKNPKVSLIP